MKTILKTITVLSAFFMLTSFTNAPVRKTSCALSQTVSAEDEDGDGVDDIFDKCPHTPFGVPVDPQGCPLF